AVELLDAIEIVRVALVERLADVLVGLAGELEAQPVVLDALAPEIVELGFALRPWRLLAIELVALVGREVEALRQEPARIVDALGDALLVEIEDRERRGEILVVDCVVEPGLVLAEAVDVALREEEPIAVERIEIALEDLRRH